MLLLASLFFVQASAWSQPAPATKHAGPRWVSEKGYWIIENNLHIPKKYVVYFYTNEGQLVHKQHIEGVTLKVHKRKVKMRLKRSLETAVLTYQKSQESENGRESLVGSQEPDSSQ